MLRESSAALRFCQRKMPLRSKIALSKPFQQARLQTQNTTLPGPARCKFCCATSSSGDLWVPIKSEYPHPRKRLKAKRSGMSTETMPHAHLHVRIVISRRRALLPTSAGGPCTYHSRCLHKQCLRNQRLALGDKHSIYEHFVGTLTEV